MHLVAYISMLVGEGQHFGLMRVKDEMAKASSGEWRELVRVEG